MREKININKGDTDVKRMNIIDFSTLETADHKDDENNWNSLEPYGENDAAEAEYDNIKTMTPGELQHILKRAKAGKIGQRAIEILAV